jgi:hypothetical protein
MTAAQRSTANRLIADKGLTVTLTRQAAGEYDPATGTTAITTTTQTGKGVILPLGSNPAFRKFDGNIVLGDQYLLLSALSTAGAPLDPPPTVDDTVTLAGGKVVSLIAVEPLEPAGLDIMYSCIARAAA